MTTTAYIGLGSNLEDRLGHLGQAVLSLGRLDSSGTVRVSRYKETLPVGGPPGQAPYVNAVVELETELDPEALLDRLQTIEREQGRVRHEHWGARTLDLDLLLYGQAIIATDRLTVPHPRLAFRKFVLVPLAEIAPDVIEPKSGRSIRDLLANADQTPLGIDLVGWQRFAPEALEHLQATLGLGVSKVFDSQGVSEPAIPVNFRVRWDRAIDGRLEDVNDWVPEWRIVGGNPDSAILEVLTLWEGIRGKPAGIEPGTRSRGLEEARSRQ